MHLIHAYIYSDNYTYITYICTYHLHRLGPEQTKVLRMEAPILSEERAMAPWLLQVCCSVLQCVVVCPRRLRLCLCDCWGVVLQCVAGWCIALQYVAVYYSVLQCVAVCCSVLQCVAVCCSVLQKTALWPYGCCKCCSNTNY